MPSNLFAYMNKIDLSIRPILLMLTEEGTLQFLTMFAFETRIVSFADWLRLKIPFSTKDKIFLRQVFSLERWRN